MFDLSTPESRERLRQQLESAITNCEAGVEVSDEELEKIVDGITALAAISGILVSFVVDAVESLLMAFSEAFAEHLSRFSGCDFGSGESWTQNGDYVIPDEVRQMQGDEDSTEEDEFSGWDDQTPEVTAEQLEAMLSGNCVEYDLPEDIGVDGLETVYCAGYIEFIEPITQAEEDLIRLDSLEDGMIDEDDVYQDMMDQARAEAAHEYIDGLSRGYADEIE
jgi:hypothetical protein